MKKTILPICWIIFLIYLIEHLFGMLSAPNTIQNISGLFILIILVIITWKTKCLTKFNNNNGKNS